MLNEVTFTNRDGEELTVNIGDHVGFKSDVEQTAEVVEIKWQSNGYCGQRLTLVVKAPPDGFSGNYIGRADYADIDATDIW